MYLPVPTVDAGYRNYAELLLRRHQFLSEGQEEGPEMEEIEEDLSRMWETLSEAQQRSLNGMGSDLNWVRRGGAPPPRGRPADAVSEEDRRRLSDAESRGDWHVVLHSLRVCASVLAVEDLARRRAAAYAGLGFQSYAEAFRGLVGDAGRRHLFVHETAGGVGSTLTYASNRDPTSTDELRWSPAVSAVEEDAVFWVARSHDISDGEGRVYGVLRSAGGVIHDLGVWHQQFAMFSQNRPDLPWAGHPVWPLHQEVLAGRLPQRALPPIEPLHKMNRVGLLTTRERKRLARGNHV
jgi:hypothetical protein